MIQNSLSYVAEVRSTPPELQVMLFLVFDLCPVFDGFQTIIKRIDYHTYILYILLLRGCLEAYGRLVHSEMEFGLQTMFGHPLKVK